MTHDETIRRSGRSYLCLPFPEFLMRPSLRRSARLLLRSATLAALSCAVAAPIVSAQGPVFATADKKRFSIEDLAARWASLERPMIGIEGLTDTQRDSIEALEERYRKQLNDAAAPIKDARREMMRQGPFDRQVIETALMRMKALRQKQLAELGTLLTREQRVKYDQNLKEIEAEEAAADLIRERDAAFYNP
jgi:Spy/CpxP family protein refolding chaperone